MVIDHIVSNVLTCLNYKVTYKVNFLAYDMKCLPVEGLHKDALGYARQSAQESTSVLSFPNSRMVQCQCHYYWSQATISHVSTGIGDRLQKIIMLFFSRWVYWSGRSPPGTVVCERAKAAPQVSILWRMCQMCWTELGESPCIHF